MSFGEGGALHQDRYHQDIASQRRRDLLAYQVLGIIQSTSAVRVTGVEPLLTDDNNHHLDCVDGLIDQPAVVDSWPDASMSMNTS